MCKDHHLYRSSHQKSVMQMAKAEKKITTSHYCKSCMVRYSPKKDNSQVQNEQSVAV